jgi:hypothetical protein
MGKKRSKRTRKKEEMKRSSMSAEQRERQLRLKEEKLKETLLRQKKNKERLEDHLKAVQKERERISPSFLVCNGCGTEIDREFFEYYRTDYFEGLDLFISGYCEDCNSDTYGVLGTQEACLKANHMLAISSKEEYIQGPIISFEAKSVS